MEIPQVEKGYSPLDFGEVLGCSLRYWFKGLPSYLLLYLSLNLVTVATAYGLIFLSGFNPWVGYVASLFIPSVLRVLFPLPLPPVDLVTIVFLVVFAVIFLVCTLLGVFVSATVVKHAADRHEGLEPNLKACFSHAWGCKFPLIGSFLLVTLITTAIVVGLVFLLVGLMFYLFFSLLIWSPSLLPLVLLGIMFGAFIAITLPLILLVYILIRLSVYMPAVVLDGAGAVESLRTSWRIVKGRFWRTFAILLIIGLITGAIVAPATLLSVLLQKNFITPLPPIILIFTVIHVATTSIAAPLTSVTCTMIYHDLMGRCYGA